MSDIQAICLTIFGVAVLVFFGFMLWVLEK